MVDYTSKITEYFVREKKIIDSIPKHDLSIIMNVLEESRKTGKTIFIMGNGGSGATASHFVCDFNKGISDGKDETFRAYRFVCLNDNIPIMLAISNDVSYDDIFVQQLRGLFVSGDIVIGISASGNSKNILKAIEYANNHDGITIGFEGYQGGMLKEIAMYSVHVPVDDMQITEDIHMMFDHCMMKVLSENTV